MRMIKKIKSAAEFCLLSFVRFLRSKKLAGLRRRVVCVLCALSFIPMGLSFSSALSGSHIALSDGTVLTQQSIELHPNGEDSHQTVTLEGMMPEGATAKAVDVLNASLDETDEKEQNRLFSQRGSIGRIRTPDHRRTATL